MYKPNAIHTSLKKKKMNIQEMFERSDTLLKQLFHLWEGSVKATHTFLSQSEIEAIAPYVPEGLKGIAQLFVAFDAEQAPVAFMGIDGEKIEMLFVAQHKLRQGIGKKLVTLALEQYGCKKVCVNEQNPEAVKFYQHMGFSITERCELDKQGNPYPILHMQHV